MEVKLSNPQIDKLSDLLIDIAKGLFLATIIGPGITSLFSIITMIKALSVAFLFTYLSLKLLDIKKEKL